MRALAHTAVFVVLFALSFPMRAPAGEVIDRIVVTVNGTAILESDWHEAVRFECLLEQKALQSLTPADLKATLERVIDQTLIRQQMQSSKFSMLSAAETSRRVHEIQEQAARNFAQRPGITWEQALEKYGLSNEQFEARAGLQVKTLGFIDGRFRPNIRIDRASVETYYREKLLPEVQRNGGKQTPLAEVSPKIEELLVQQRMDEMLTAWLHSLRAQSEVKLR
jgi:hypothetical protein